MYVCVQGEGGAIEQGGEGTGGGEGHLPQMLLYLDTTDDKKGFI